MMNRIPKISVITGAYNIESIAHLHAVFQSVLNQTFSDFEWVVCDDGSTDKTYEILKEYQKLDCRIKIIRNEKNMGLAASLNNCIDQSKGDYVARQDMDDISHLNRFMNQSLVLDKHEEISFVGSNVNLFNEKGTWGIRKLPQYPQKKDFLFTMPYVHGSLMFRREALSKVKNYRVAKETRRAEDYDMLMRMCKLGLNGVNIQDTLYDFCEDIFAVKRRKYKYRIDEAKVRWKGFRNLELLPEGIFYVVKPLIVGLIPQRLLLYLKKRYSSLIFRIEDRK